MDSPDRKAIDHAADLIQQADALIVAAGAGMGVDSKASGRPTRH
jgi:hypothetical protein